MKESPPNADVQESGSRGFRFSPQLMAIILVTLLALATPLTILSIGLVRMTRPVAGAAAASPAPEAPGLRAILERAADDKLAPAPLSDGRGRIVVVDEKENWNRSLLQIEAAAKELGCTVVPDMSGDRARVLVQVPAEAANRFVASLAPNASVDAEPAQNGRLLVYQVHFQEKP